MDLLDNPFHLLGATPRDNRQRIVDLADDRSLLGDPSICMQARSDLTNPRNRLSAEVAWLPGIGPRRVGEVITLLESSPASLLSIDKVTPIARVNFLAAGLPLLPEYSAGKISEWVLAIAWAFEAIDPEKVCEVINQDRVVAGFPEVTDLSAVEFEVQERRRHCRLVIRSALDNLPVTELVEAVTRAVALATNDGETHGPVLIEDLVDAYDVEAQAFLKKEEENILTLVELLRTSADSGKPDTTLESIVDQLTLVVRNWDRVAQPIQVSTKSRGLDHTPSQRVAMLVREVAVHLFNEHGELELSQKLTGMLRDVFAEVGEVAERTAEDASVLGEIAVQRERELQDAKSRAEKWRREITYEAEVGLVFKDRLRISPEGIEWKNRKWDLDTISRTRWGGTRHSVNGIPTGTTYTIRFGNASGEASIELRREETYSRFVNCLWRSVGVRLLTEYLHGLHDGNSYRFGSAVVSDHGMELERKKLFSSNERVFCTWDELRISSGPGVFCIESSEDKKLTISLSYLLVDNLHVLEAAVRTLWERGGEKLSSILED